MTYDAIIVGARCAGSATAMLLARQGHRVLVIDRATFPSDTLSTHCVIAPGVVQLMRWDLLDRIVATNVERSFVTTVSFGGIEMPAPAQEAPQFGPIGTISPRRTVLDKILVDAAREAGAEVREGVTLKDLTRSEEQVTGVVGRDSDGNRVEEQGRIIIGADGMRSTVARLVDAPRYDERPANFGGYYAYFRNVENQGVELRLGDDTGIGLFPTNDGEVCIFGGRPLEDAPAYKRDVETMFDKTLEQTWPDLAERVRKGERTSRFHGFFDVENFYRVPYGPGWALVGDAGFHKDPITGHGITDAFRDAELLANAVHAGLNGTAMADALGEYQRQRDEVSKPIYDATCAVSAGDLPPEQLPEVFVTLVAGFEQELRFILAFDD